jgi:hypothetical protein
MKKMFIRGCLVLLLIMGMVATASALPITGDIAFSGGATPNAGLASATQLTLAGITTVGVPAPTSDFSGVAPGTSVTMSNPFIFSPFTPQTSWWTFSSGADIFTLDTLTGSVVTQTSNFLNVAGTGTVWKNAANPSPYFWSFTATGAQGAVTFAGGISNSSQPFTTPEPGTLLMFGLGLIGLAGIRRK